MTADIMNDELFLEELLRWRLSEAEAEAPPSPGAIRLLELAKPWWETWPERARSLLERLARMEFAYGHAMADPHQRSGRPVPVLLVREHVEEETSARVLYLDLRDGRLRLRFHLDQDFGEAEPSLEVTFVSKEAERPLFSAEATLSLDREYRLDTNLPEQVAGSWAGLTVTDPMPFRLIVRGASSAG